MDIIKLINPDGTCKLEIVSNDYNKDKQIIEEICNAARNIVSGNNERIETAKEVLASLLWQTTKKLAQAEQKNKKLQETIEIDNIQIAHYDDELKQAKSLLSGMVIGAAVTESALNFLDRKETINHDKNSAHDS